MRRLTLLVAAAASLAAAVPHRIVVVKADGLPADTIDRWVHSTDPKSGRSRLPWIERVFIEQGTWVRNFYTRGVSLSAPSWTMLETGAHMPVRGNAEYDRFTLRVYDYLNFFPFYLNYARNHRVDMPGIEVLDQMGLPLLFDRYENTERLLGPQLLQRGFRWVTLQYTLRHRFGRSPRQLFDEWQTGFNFTSSLADEVERELVNELADPRRNYFDYFFADYDHVAHLASDDASILDVLQKLDALVGRLWKAIQQSPRAGETILVLVSDHGMNAEPGVLSQGYNLIRVFGSPEGGGHHVITNRHPLTEFKIKGLDPFVSEVMSPSPASYYLRDQSASYPTAVLDLDGNERASVHLRSSFVNRVHMLLQRVLSGEIGAPQELLALIDIKRAAWTRIAHELEAELEALARAIERHRTLVAALPRKFTKDEVWSEADDKVRRERVELEIWQQDGAAYRERLAMLRRLLALKMDDLRTGRVKIDQLVNPRFLGENNSIHELQNYAAGRSARIDYFRLLAGLRVKNNVQAGVGSRPIDFVAVRAPCDGIAEINRSVLETCVFVYSDDEHQALLLSRRDSGRLMIRFEPVAGLRQQVDGKLTFQRRDWKAGLPLKLFEDSNLDVSGGRAAWLREWHSDYDWLIACHRTAYSNGVPGLIEYFAPLPQGRFARLWRGAGADTELLRQFAMRKRRLVEADLLILAADHWNFNVRGFNPGGNHGAFFRASTNSTLMLSGADVRKGNRIDGPYDSLSYLPTMLRVGGLEPGEDLSRYPGKPIEGITERTNAPD